MRRQRLPAGLGARGPVRSPRRGTTASSAFPWSPAVQDWLDFLARLLVEAATEERAGMTPEDRRPRA
jgi:hypothetical protein